jgi:hypothetical protein
MDAFLRGTKRKSSGSAQESETWDDNDDSTEVKLAMLASLCPDISQEILLDALLVNNGSVDKTVSFLTDNSYSGGEPKKRGRAASGIGSQTSLRSFASPSSVVEGAGSPKKKKLLSKKGTTLYLYDPDDIAEHTPCSVIHNFLPLDEANDLLQEMLHEADSFEKVTFKLFDNVVQSPHTSSFFLTTEAEINMQKHEYFYNGARLTVSTASYGSMSPVFLFFLPYLIALTVLETAGYFIQLTGGRIFEKSHLSSSRSSPRYKKQ